MKQLQFWTVIIGLFLSVLALGGYAYNVSAYAATLGEKVQDLQRRQEEEKENYAYIRDRVDKIYNILRQQNCGQCKE